MSHLGKRLKTIVHFLAFLGLLFLLPDPIRAALSVTPSLVIPTGVGATSGSGSDATTYEAASLPGGAVFYQVEVSGDALVLSKDADGHYYDEGYVDIPLSAALTGTLLQIDATSVNLIRNGDFTSLTSATAYLATSSCGACARGDKAAGSWLTTGTSSTYLPLIEADPDDAADTVAKLRRLNYLLQLVPVAPGETYTLNWDADLTRLATDYTDPSDGSLDNQGLVVGVGFYDADLNDITFFHPWDNSTETRRQQQVYYSEGGEDRLHLKIGAIDCDTRVKYAAGTGTYASDISFNFCQDENGTALTASSDDGTVTNSYAGSDIRYMSVQFYTNWFGTSTTPSNHGDYYAIVDDVELYRDDEISAEILDGSGNVLQSATVEDGFHLMDNASAVTLRVHLRSSYDSMSPEIRSFMFKAGWDVNVTVGAKTAEFTEERIGTNWVVGPKSDYNNEDIAIRSLCEDPIVGDEVSCMTLNDRYDMHGYRFGLSPGSLKAELNADATDYDFSLTESGEITLSRVVEMDGYGLEMLALLQKDGTVYYADPDDGKSWDVLTGIDELPDPTGARDTTEQAYHLMEKYARFWTEMFSGSTTYTYEHIKSGTSVVVPKVTLWEIFNEDNINDTDWLDLGSWDHEEDAAERRAIAETMADLAEDMSEIVKSVIPDASVSSTGLSAYGDSFDTETLADYFAYLDPADFDMTNFHPYADGIRREEIESTLDSLWDTAEATLSTYGFSAKPPLFTEYGFTHEIYDPGCEYDASLGRYVAAASVNEDWEKGYGETEFGKLIARQTLSLLALPARMIKPYGAHTYENESHGFNAEDDGSGGYECWRSHSLYNFYMYDRVAGTGILAGKDEPSRYQANEAGKAYLTLAKYLSVSNPMETTIESADDKDAGENDYHHAQVFDVGGGSYVLALWWYQDYTHGGNATVMSYVYGANDEGFTEERLFNVALSGVDGVNSAKLVRLDGSGTEAALEVLQASDGVVISSVPAGEMPSLVVLEFDPTIADSDSDGLSDAIDPSPNVKNSWWWVNKDKAKVSLAAKGSYTFVKGESVAGKILAQLYPGGVKVSGILDASQAQKTVIFSCPETSSSASSSAGWAGLTDNLSKAVSTALEGSVASVSKSASSGAYGICVKSSPITVKTSPGAVIDGAAKTAK